MKRFKQTLIVLSFLCVSITNCLIIETDSMQYVANKIFDKSCENSKKLVVFDIDGTIAENLQEFGGNKFYVHLYNKKIEEGLSSYQAHMILYHLVKKIEDYITMQLVEAVTPSLIAQMQNAGIMVIGLTGRCEPLVDLTLKWINSFGIQLSAIPHNILKKSYAFPLECKNGIIFSGFNDKGAVLLDFMQTIQEPFEKVIIVDDVLHNLENIERAFKGSSVEVVSFYYTRSFTQLACDPVVSEEKLKNILMQVNV